MDGAPAAGKALLPGCSAPAPSGRADAATLNEALSETPLAQRASAAAAA